MRSFHLPSLAFVLALLCPGVSSGQETSGQVLARGRHAAISAEPAIQVEQSSFPSLAQRASRHAPTGPDGEPPSETSPLGGPSVITVASSLAVVLGLFAALVWMTRKFGSNSLGHGTVPKDWIQGLGSTPIDSRTRITMVRCGNRILVMAQTPTAVHPLSEITDPDEVRQLTAACLGDSKQNFASALQSLENEQVSQGFVGSPTDASTPRDRPASGSSAQPRARGGLFASA